MDGDADTTGRLGQAARAGLTELAELAGLADSAGLAGGEWTGWVSWNEWSAWLSALPPAAAYLTVALVLAAETGLVAGIVLPAEPLLLLAGYLVACGRLDMGHTVATTTIAALAGDWLGYLSGRWYGPRLRAGRVGRLVGDARWDRADRLFGRHGGAAVLVGRWLAFARTLTPRLAGAARVTPLRFGAWDLAAVTVWVPGSVLAGYLAGASYERLSGWLSSGTLAVLGAVVVVAAAVRALPRRRVGGA